QNNDVVGVGPLIDAGFLHELLLDYPLILQAAMECDDQAAGLTARTILRHEQPASAVHAIVLGIAAAGERILIELDIGTVKSSGVRSVQAAVEIGQIGITAAGERVLSSGVLGVQAPVEIGQKSMLGIHAAVVDIRNVGTGARIRAIGGDPAVGGWHTLVIGNVAAVGIGFVVLLQHIHHALVDRCVIGAAEHINRLVRDIAGRIDRAVGRLIVCIIDQCLQRDATSAFAIPLRSVDAALSTIVWATGEDRRTEDALGEG